MRTNPQSSSERPAGCQNEIAAVINRIVAPAAKRTASGSWCFAHSGVREVQADDSDHQLAHRQAGKGLVLDVEVRGDFVALRGQLLVGVGGERAKRDAMGVPGSGRLGPRQVVCSKSC